MLAVRRRHASPRAQPSSAVHCSSIFAHIGVSTAPGQMQLDVILSRANACAAVRVMLTTPAFVAAYGPVKGLAPRYAAMEAVWISLPRSSEPGMGSCAV